MRIGQNISMAQTVPISPTARFPVRLTSFVGRVTEMRLVGDALGGRRLVSLVGPGGSGKTRLALEAARAWPEGERWFVDLAPVEPGGVDAALAVGTDAPEGPGEPPLDATVRRIGEAPALLLVDNCDQVVAESARAVDVLLRACPGLTVLATSREPLRVEGEHVWRVPPLSVDSINGDAVLLFLDRAGLSPDAASRDIERIHDICLRLDGMPLAIELAASRATVLPLADVLAGLSDRFRLLSGGPRTAASRQQSLAGSLDWSYRLLTDNERTVLRRLAVLRGPFTVEGARAVAVGDQIDEGDMLPLLASLVEKSFVVVDERLDEARYRLLETIREYAAARLAEQPDDATATRDRHLRYLRETAERNECLVDSESWGRLEIALPDIRSALAWAAVTGNADEALRLVGAMGSFFWCRARRDGRGIIESALAIDGGEPRWRARAYTAACQAAFARFEPDGIAIGEEAVRIATEAGDSSVLARATLQLGYMGWIVNWPGAEKHLSRARELAREADDQWCLIGALAALAVAARGHPVAARKLGEEALALALNHDHLLAATHARIALLVAGFMQGRLEETHRLVQGALRVGEALGEASFVAGSHFFLTAVAALRGDDDLAAEHAHAAERTAQASGSPLAEGFALAAEGWHAFGRGDLASSRSALTTALPTFSLLEHGLHAPQMAAFLADVAFAVGDADGARAHVAQAAELAESAGYDWGRSRAAIARCRLDLHDGEVQAAADAAYRALELSQRGEDAITTIDSLELLAQIAMERRTPDVAARLLGAAAAERARIGYARFKVHVPAHEALVHDLQTTLGAEPFARAWAEGERMPVADAVASARSRRGRRGRPAFGWDALTPAELRVAALVGEGLNNVQIAERLFVTRDTVKDHVAAAFRKLSLTSRAELAAEVSRRTANRT